MKNITLEAVKSQLSEKCKKKNGFVCGALRSRYLTSLDSEKKTFKMAHRPVPDQPHLALSLGHVVSA